MNTNKYKELQQYLASKSQYFKNIEFFILAEDYEKAANAIQELSDLIDKIEAPVVVEATNE